MAYEVEKTEDEWRSELSAAEYHVLREAGTERAGSSPLDKEKRRGTFLCAGCDLPVYSSAAKFDSGTGWPSFTRPLEPDNIVTPAVAPATLRKSRRLDFIGVQNQLCGWRGWRRAGGLRCAKFMCAGWAWRRPRSPSSSTGATATARTGA